MLPPLWVLVPIAAVVLLAAAVAVYDLVQRKHAVTKNFPVIGHLRFLTESFGPEVRQYLVANNNEERPFSRDQRRWVYSSAKTDDTKFSFGTDNDLENGTHSLVVKHSAFPLPTRPGDHRIPCAKVLGGASGRAKAFRPESVVNVSAMSYGALSGPAVEALNRGASIAGYLHNTGEGGVSPHHLHGGDLVFQVGTGYFGCRDTDGTFSLDRLVDLSARYPSIRAVEIKLSQGAKPGLGGLLPAAKVTPEIAAMRGVPVGVDCVSPPHHTAFSDASSLLDFIEEVADATGLPVGIKSAVGDSQFWADLARLTATTGRAPDFVSVDGGEGGTGAAPLAFTDHVSLPFKIGFSRVWREFAEHGATDGIVWVGAGRLGFPEQTALAMSLGCDMVAVAREPMLALGCIQAQRCHTGRCPTGVATQSPWLTRGLDPALKSVRAANYVMALRHETLLLAHACGVEHPTLITPDLIEFVDDRFASRTAADVFDVHRTVTDADRSAVRNLMAEGVPDAA